VESILTQTGFQFPVKELVACMCSGRFDHLLFFN
jgi:hypothetical protein